MKSLTRLFVAAATVLAAITVSPPETSAHSLDDVQQDLLDKEKYFQLKDERAPEFVLQDAAGNPMGLEDLQGKVVVLHFIYAGCPDV